MFSISYSYAIVSLTFLFDNSQAFWSESCLKSWILQHSRIWTADCVCRYEFDSEGETANDSLNRLWYSLFDRIRYSNNRSHSRASTCNKPWKGRFVGTGDLVYLMLYDIWWVLVNSYIFGYKTWDLIWRCFFLGFFPRDQSSLLGSAGTADNWGHTFGSWSNGSQLEWLYLLEFRVVLE